jgi:hypothetical protein
MDELQQLLALMSANSFAEAVAVLTSVNAIIDSESAALGTRGPAATLTALKSRGALLSAIEKATGKTGDDAVGAVRAALTSHEELPKLQKRVADLEKSGQTHALDAAFAKADADKKLSPAIKLSVQAAFDAGDVTLKGAESWLENLLPISALAAKPKQESAPKGAPAGEVLKHNGKTFVEMSGPERADLHKADKDMYEAMRSSAA